MKLKEFPLKSRKKHKDAQSLHRLRNNTIHSSLKYLKETKQVKDL